MSINYTQKEVVSFAKENTMSRLIDLLIEELEATWESEGRSASDDKEELDMLMDKYKEGKIPSEEAISFGTWYSGMTRDKVTAAYSRYKKESQ